MASYLVELEQWRANAMARIHQLVAASTATQTDMFQ